MDAGGSVGRGVRAGSRGAGQRQLYAHGAGCGLRADGHLRPGHQAGGDHSPVCRQGERIPAGAEPLHLSPRSSRADHRRRQQGGWRVLRSGRRDLRPHRQPDGEGGLRAGEYVAAGNDVALRSSRHSARLPICADCRGDRPVRREIRGPAKGGRIGLLRLRRQPQGHRKEEALPARPHLG